MSVNGFSGAMSVGSKFTLEAVSPLAWPPYSFQSLPSFHCSRTNDVLSVLSPKKYAE